MPPAPPPAVSCASLYLYSNRGRLARALAPQRARGPAAAAASAVSVVTQRNAATAALRDALGGGARPLAAASDAPLFAMAPTSQPFLACLHVSGAAHTLLDHLEHALLGACLPPWLPPAGRSGIFSSSPQIFNKPESCPLHSQILLLQTASRSCMPPSTPPRQRGWRSHW